MYTKLIRKLVCYSVYGNGHCTPGNGRSGHRY